MLQERRRFPEGIVWRVTRHTVSQNSTPPPHRSRGRGVSCPLTGPDVRQLHEAFKQRRRADCVLSVWQLVVDSGVSRGAGPVCESPP